jgi:hypothetical protein
MKLSIRNPVAKSIPELTYGRRIFFIEIDVSKRNIATLPEPSSSRLSLAELPLKIALRDSQDFVFTTIRAVELKLHPVRPRT